MLTRRELLGQIAKVLAGGIAVASGVLVIVPVEPKIIHGKQAKMWVNDIEITKDTPPRRDTYRVLMHGPYLPSTKYLRSIVTVDRQFLIDNGVSPYLPKVGDSLYLADDSFFGIFVD